MDKIDFVGSFDLLDACPSDGLPQYAFVGRSNVGKSSLINTLCGRKSLARISKQPGKTQMMNFFRIESTWYLVDLPGYGYARESKKKRAKWDMMVRNYLEKAPYLMTAFVLVDSNIPPQQRDLDFINWLGEAGIPFALIYTKVDRHRRTASRQKGIAQIRQALLDHWTSLPAEFEVSSVTGEGRDPLLDYIVSLNHSIQTK